MIQDTTSRMKPRMQKKNDDAGSRENTENKKSISYEINITQALRKFRGKSRVGHIREEPTNAEMEI